MDKKLEKARKELTDRVMGKPGVTGTAITERRGKDRPGGTALGSRQLLGRVDLLTLHFFLTSWQDRRFLVLNIVREFF